MRIRKDKMIKAIDFIIAETEKRQLAFDKAAVEWEKERRREWLRTEKPKWKALQKLIATKSAANATVDFDDVAAIFPVGSGYSSGTPRLECFHPQVDVPGTLKFVDGRKVYRPSGININQMQAMKRLLEAVEDDVVSDSVLARLGVKDVGPIFRQAVELGGLVQ